MNSRALLLFLLVGCNTPPGAPVVAITPNEPLTTDDLEVVVQGNAADKQGDAVTYSYAWFVDDAPRAHLTSTLVPADETTRGEVWKVVVTPSDGTLDGTPAEASVIIGNSLPSTTLAVDPPIPTAADAMIATATTSDEDDDPVTVAWSWSRNGVLFGVTTNELPLGTLTRGDVWEVTATPADDAAAGSPATLGFTVENARPTLETVMLGPAGATVADALTASFSGASDPDGDAVDVRVAWMVDGIEVFTEVVGGEESATLSGLYGKGAEVVVIATPTDGYDDGAPVTSELLVIADSPPSATGAHIVPDPVYVDSVVTCVGEGWADADGDDEGWRTTWTVDGAVVSADAVLPAGSYTRGSVLGCELVPYDGELEGSGVTAADVTVQNSAPACATTGITIGPDPATLADTLIVTGDAWSGCVDADGDSIVLAYNWQVDGVLVSTSSTLAAGSAPRGSTVVLTAAWSDGLVTGATATSNPITVVNAPPTVTTLSLEPTPITAADTVSALVAAADPEGDAVTLAYAWTVDGVYAGAGETLVGSAAFSRGQTVVLTVTPNDGYDDGAPVSAATVVENAAPVAPTLGILPAHPGPDEDLVCSILVAASDADGDALGYTFSWEVGGVPYAATATTLFPGDTVPANVTVTGQQWTCLVSVTDGTTSTSASVSAEVGCDDDADGYAAINCGGDDCNDTDAAIHPGTVEVCDAADIDEDCDGLADDADPSLSATLYYPDADGDTYGDSSAGVAACTRPSGYLTNGDDCDDSRASVRPGGQEQCDAADADEDCDGTVDDADPTVSGQISLYVDADGDGYGDEAATLLRVCDAIAGYARTATDCDDADTTVSPAATEVCQDGVDNNCDDTSYPCGVSGTGGAGNAWASYTGTSGAFGSYESALGDVNCDGLDDVVIGSSPGVGVSVWLSPHSSGDHLVSGDDATLSVASNWYNVGSNLGVVGDMDGDGCEELILAGVGRSGISSVTWILPGDPAFADTVLSNLAVTGPASGSPNDQAMGGVGDFDGDGYADAFLGYQPSYGSTSPGSVTLYRGDPSGTWSTVTWSATAYRYGDKWGSTSVGDMDGDGFDDLATRLEPSSGVAGLVVLLGEAAPVAATLTVAGDAWYTDANSMYPCEAGDINDDGYADVGVSTGTSLRFLLGPPTGTITSADAYTTAVASTCMEADTDGDGAQETLVSLFGSYTYVYSQPLSSGSISSPEASLYVSTDTTSVGDPTGDGYDDLLLTGDYFGYLFTGGFE